MALSLHSLHCIVALIILYLSISGRGKNIKTSGLGIIVFVCVVTFFFTSLQQGRDCNEKQQYVRDIWKQCKTRVTMRGDMSKPREILTVDKKLNNRSDARRHLSAVKLKRTDTTLDL